MAVRTGRTGRLSGIHSESSAPRMPADQTPQPASSPKSRSGPTGPFGELQPVGDDEYVMYKPRWGAFYQTALHDRLVDWHSTRWRSHGATFPNCPRTTLYEASERPADRRPRHHRVELVGAARRETRSADRSAHPPNDTRTPSMQLLTSPA